MTVQAFRIEVMGSDYSRDGGTGGFALTAESAIPIMVDLNANAGREALGITDSALAALGEASVIVAQSVALAAERCVKGSLDQDREQR